MNGILDRLFPASPMMGLLGEDQQQLALQQARQQGLLGLAAGLLQAGGPSRTRTNIGQAIGTGLMGGQQMYQKALEQQLQGQLTMEKVGEARRLREQQALARQLMPQLVQQGPATVAGMQQLVTRDEEGNLLPGYSPGAMQINQAAANALMSVLPPADFAKFMDAIKTQFELGKPPKPELREVGGTLYSVEGRTATPIVSAAATPKLQTVGDTLYEVVNGKATPIVSQTGKLTGQYSNEAKLLFGTDVVSQLPPDAADRINAALIKKAEANRTIIDMTGGQKGFDNETNLRKEFQGLPETKAFGEMKSAYGQVLEGLNKANAVGDLAAATKIMKLLDPGSVVRESELAMAMQAGGLMDRVTNYATKIMQGTKLSPEQRKDFADLAKSLFSVSFDAFSEKRNQYRSLADQYGLNVNRVVGLEPELPAPKATGVTASDLQRIAREEQARRRRGQ